MSLMTGWPTDADEGSVANEARWRSMARLFAPSGVVTGLVPTLAAGPIINVTAGSAWLDGHYAQLASPASESASANGLLVVRFTAASNVFELVYRDGVSTPTQTDPVWELPIAKMTSSALTDIRPITGGGQSSARFQRTSAQSIPNNTSTTVTGYITVHSDDPTLFSVSAGVVTVSRPCILSITGAAQFAANGTGYRELRLRFNSGVENDIAVGFSPSSTVPISLGVQSGAFKFTAGWSFLLKAFQNSGGALDVSGTDFNAFLAVTRVG